MDSSLEDILTNFDIDLFDCGASSLVSLFLGYFGGFLSCHFINKKNCQRRKAKTIF